MYRIVALTISLLLLVMPANGHAVTIYYVSFIPSSPNIQEPVTARVSSSSGPSCLPPATSITVQDTTIELQLDYSDSCATGSPIPYRDYALGGFPSGRYSFQIKSCQNNPPPFPTSCNTSPHGGFVVGAHFAPVPSLSRWSLGLLMLGVIVTIALRKQLVLGIRE